MDLIGVNMRKLYGLFVSINISFLLSGCIGYNPPVIEGAEYAGPNSVKIGYSGDWENASIFNLWLTIYSVKTNDLYYIDDYGDSSDFWFFDSSVIRYRTVTVDRDWVKGDKIGVFCNHNSVVGSAEFDVPE
jgi:hypothetical protein